MWNTFQPIKPEDTQEQIEEKNFYNSILADKKPYFFRYKYSQTDKELRDFIENKNLNCHCKFGMYLDDLLAIPENEQTEAQKEFLRYYYHRLPVNDSNCVMNKICHYIEHVDFHIKKKVHSSEAFDYRVLQSENFTPNRRIYEGVKEVMRDFLSEQKIRRATKVRKGAFKDKSNINLDVLDKESENYLLKQKLEIVNPNDEIIVNHLIQLFYVDKPSYNKNILWGLYGKQIFENIRIKTQACYFPKKNEHGTMEYLYEKYSIEKVDLNNIWTKSAGEPRGLELTDSDIQNINGYRKEEIEFDN